MSEKLVPIYFFLVDFTILSFIVYNHFKFFFIVLYDINGKCVRVVKFSSL